MIEVVGVVDNAPLDANPGPGGGQCVFPDRLSPGDATSRENVIVRVRTTPPAKVRLRVLDVDDPSPLQDDPDRIVDATDLIGGGAAGNDNRGTNRLGWLTDTVLTLDSLGNASAVFRVTLQPGDNFRLAAVLDTEGASNHLNQLQVDNDSADFYVTPDTNQVPHFFGTVSPMLTVWRKLHLEFDSMTAPPNNPFDGNYATGLVTRTTLNYPVAGHSEIRLFHANINSRAQGLFDQGKLEIPGRGTYRVVHSGTVEINQYTASTTVEIDSVPSGVTNGAPIRLYDDDDQYLANDPLYPSLLGLPSPPLPVTSTDNQRTTDFVEGIKSRFGFAYILPVDANALNWNTTRTIPFKRNAGTSLSGGTFDAGNQELNRADKPEF